MSNESHDTAAETKRYFKVGSALLVFTIITVAISYLKIDLIQIVVLIAMAIALFKSSLVAGFFMHLFHEVKLIYWILAMTFLFFFGLMLIPILESKSVPEGTIVFDKPASSDQQIIKTEHHGDEKSGH